MGFLTEKEKKEFLELVKSKDLRNDFRIIRKNKINPFLKSDGSIDIDKYIQFLNEYNNFINHTPKPFKPILIKINKLL